MRREIRFQWPGWAPALLLVALLCLNISCSSDAGKFDGVTDGPRDTGSEGGSDGSGGADLIVDSNRDGYAEFAVGESAFGIAGRVVVFY